MKILFGNYGNQTIAAMQWLYEHEISNLYVISIDTGWAAENWEKRVKASEQLAKKYHFNVVRLQSKPIFENLIKDRQEFPSTKFQWCAGFLKGLTLLNWLDERDPQCESTIILGKRRLDSRVNFDLPEFIEASEHYGGRKIWHPLYNCEDQEFDRLIKGTNLEFLSHRSLECDPCINNMDEDFKRMDEKTFLKTQKLENNINKKIFDVAISDKIKQVKAHIHTKKKLEAFSMGCGSPFSCGE